MTALLPGLTVALKLEFTCEPGGDPPQPGAPGLMAPPGGRRDPTIGRMEAPGRAYVGASDAFTWRMERDPALRWTIVVVDWLDRAPDWEVLVARVDRIFRLVPSLRHRVVESVFGLTVPGGATIRARVLGPRAGAARGTR